MAIFRGEHEAFGRPGIDPRWTYADKEGVGTAYAASSQKRTWTGTHWRDIANGEMVDNKRRSRHVWPAARHCLRFQ